MNAVVFPTYTNSLKADALGELACQALVHEVTLTPKPALVDSRNNGAHKDMNLEMMLA